MSTSEEQHDVVVIGGGPIGLMMAIQLGLRGVDVVVIERRPGRLRHPRAIGIHARTMEILRQLGWADDVKEAGNLPLEEWSTFGYLTRLNAPDLGAIDLLADPQRVKQAYDLSPEMIAWCAQDAFEPLLMRKIDKMPSVKLITGLRVTHLEESDIRVRVVAEREDGVVQEFSGRYAIGADGARSTVRGLLDIEAPTSPTKGYQLNACFIGDMRPYIGDRRHILWWIINRDTNGAFLTYDGDRRWVYSWGYDPETTSPNDVTFDDAAEVIRLAIGDKNAEIEVERIFPWTIDASIAETFRKGRTFLVGDAAHRVPPSGGFGMNSGIQDTQNLAWKLALVLSGAAGDGLLETYNKERLTVSHLNVEQIHLNVDASAKVGWVMTDPDTLAQLEEPDGDEARQRLIDAIPLQEDQYWSYGQQFGFVYDSAAVVSDGTTAPKSTVGDYKPCATPGAHAPHVWLTGASGEQVSTIDLIGREFVLFTTPEGEQWKTALEQVSGTRGFGAAAYTIGDTGDFKAAPDWLGLYGISPGGAVLVRPDGHVAFRSRAEVDDPVQSLQTAFDQILAT